ncbi:DHH family phosphoesterase [Candidatus Saccharibacteria bacterium]|nr:DHH family phosphoesterase [Candidatus Saccharibacteria bacterium]
MYSKSSVEEVEEFKQLVSNSSRILITTHVSPDPDAVASVLLSATTLTLNYPDKQVIASSEDQPEGLDFLEGYNQLKVGSLANMLQDGKPDLIIIVDAMNLERCTRQSVDQAKAYVKNSGAKLAMIDHHEKEQIEPADLYINNGSPAVAMDLYELFFDQLKLQQPNGAGNTTMLGIYSDSGGFIYPSKRQLEMFQLVAKLVDGGVNLEELSNKLNRYSQDHIKVIGELATNITHEQAYSYSYISDTFEREWVQKGKSSAALHKGCSFFVNRYIRNVEDRKWGFIVYKDAVEGENIYSLSIRSLNGVRDVSKIAAKFDGGGHKAAAGARVQANSLKEAINKIKSVIAV